MAFDRIRGSMESEFPSNSNIKKAAAAKPEKKVESIIEANRAIKRKKPVGRRFIETFFSGESAKSIVGKVFSEVVVDKVKDTIRDAGMEALDLAVYGQSKPRPRDSKSPYGVKFTNYSGSSTSSSSGRNRQLSASARSQHNFGEIILPTKVEAELVFDNLNELISTYGAATVADLYSLVNEEPDYTDHKWGWTDLSSAKPIRVREGYLLDLPKTENLD